MKKISYLCILIFLQIQIYCQPISVLTQRYDNRRLGWNSSEKILNSENVNQREFGLLFTRQVDDQIYAQPLYVANLDINGSRQNVLFIATVNNSVYAFDADDSLVSHPLWQVNLTSAGSRVVSNTDIIPPLCGGGYFDFSGNMGIVGTPVIDTNTMTMFLISRDVYKTGTNFQQYFHAIDIRTGLDKPGSPVKIEAKYPGSGDGSVNDTISFDELRQNQRAALLLYHDVVFASWAGHCDWPPYHGWIIGFDTATLQKRYVYNDTPDGIDGGIWMSGVGPCVDDSDYIYVTVGNGTVGFNNNLNSLRDRGESILKLLPYNDSLHIVDFFTPENFENLEQNDLDYGIAGPLLIPNSTLSLSGSKEGVLYLLDNNHMGRYSANNDSVLQLLEVSSSQGYPHGLIHGTPVYYHYFSESDKECIYVWSSSDSLTQFFFNRATKLFDLSKTIKGTTSLNSSLPGAMLSVSSDLLNPGTGILWASHPTSGDANQMVRPGTLEAFDARDVRKLLWSSDKGPVSNRIGSFAKFNTPVVANGKLYMATFSNKLDVYGIYKNPLPTDISIINNNIESIELYPNPTSDNSITVHYYLSNGAKNLTLNIYDLYGRLIEIFPMDSQVGGHSVNVLLGKKFIPGIYSIIFHDDDKAFGIDRFIKE